VTVNTVNTLNVQDVQKDLPYVPFNQPFKERSMLLIQYEKKLNLLLDRLTDKKMS
jgi:hypothetical protein